MSENMQAGPGAQAERTRFCLSQYAQLHDRLDDAGVPRFNYPTTPCPNDTDGDGNCGRKNCPHCTTTQYTLIERFEFLMDAIYTSVESLTHPKPLRGLRLVERPDA
jgi:hypothetical protein